MSKISRKGARREDEAPVFILTLRDYARYHKHSYYYTYGKMVNSSGKGLCLESDYPIQPGSDIHMKIADNMNSDHQDFETKYESQDGTVKWCREMTRKGNRYYGIGVELVKKKQVRLNTYPNSIG